MTTILVKALDSVRSNFFFCHRKCTRSDLFLGDCRAHPAHKQDSLAMTAELFDDYHPLIFITHYHMIDPGV